MVKKSNKLNCGPKLYVAILCSYLNAFIINGVYLLASEIKLLPVDRRRF